MSLLVSRMKIVSEMPGNEVRVTSRFLHVTCCLYLIPILETGESNSLTNRLDLCLYVCQSQQIRRDILLTST